MQNQTETTNENKKKETDDILDSSDSQTTAKDYPITDEAAETKKYHKLVVFVAGPIILAYNYLLLVKLPDATNWMGVLIFAIFELIYFVVISPPVKHEFRIVLSAFARR